VVAAAPSDLSWESLVNRVRKRLQYIEPSGAEKAHLVVAGSALAGESQGLVVTVARLDRELASELQSQVGLPVRLPTFPSRAGTGVSFDSGTWRARRVVTTDGTDPSSVEVEVILDGSEATAVLRPLQKTFVFVTLIASAIAVAAGLLAAHFLSRPIFDLARAARRIAAGDLVTPVPSAPGAESGSLSAIMEQMRRKLLAAITELRHRETESKALVEGKIRGAFAVDNDRRIQYISPQAANQLGVSVRGALGRFCGDVLHAVSHDGRRPCDDACPILYARSRGSARAVEVLQVPGGHRTVIITSDPLSGGQQVQLIREATDIEQRQMDTLNADISHGLKTNCSGTTLGN
jgi:PAS domain-containing protein